MSTKAKLTLLCEFRYFFKYLPTVRAPTAKSIADHSKIVPKEIGVELVDLWLGLEHV
jgi:hypothetical protein